jgi:cytochrome c oxidase subunit 4
MMFKYSTKKFSAHSAAGDHGDGPHVLPMSVYMKVFGALLFLTVVTVLVSYLDMGPFGLVLALVVACAKATLVVLFFMHMLYDDKFNALIFVSSLLFVVLFFAFVFVDIGSRGLVLPEQDNFVPMIESGKSVE